MRLNDPADPRSLSYRLRKRRDRFLREFMLRGGRRILDIGGTSAYWERVGLAFLSENGFEITLLNNSKSELGDGPFEAVVGDAAATGYVDGSFDMVHSNSVIEHVGSADQMRKFASEVRRLAPAYYIQTPNRRFPIDPHFHRLPGFHFLPRAWRIEALYRFPIATSGRQTSRVRAAQIVDHTRLLSPRSFQALFPDGKLQYETITGLKKSMIVTRHD